MKKKTFMATIIIAAFLISILAGMQIVKVAKANPIPYLTTPNQDKPTLTIETPQNYTMYNVSSIPFNFTVTEPASWNLTHMNIQYVGQIDSVFIYLDGNLSNRYGMYGSGPSEPSTNFSVGLNQLAFGLHSANVTVLSYTYYVPPLTVNASGLVQRYPIVVSDLVYFTVLEESPPSPPPSPIPTLTPTLYVAQQPTVTILLPQNDSVSLGGVYQLTYVTNSTLSWVGYSIDGSDNVTVTGNSTLLPEFVSSNGYHTLTVYANDTSGSWAIPQSVTYLVNFYPDYTPTPSSSPTEQPTITPSPTQNNTLQNFVPIAAITGLIIGIIVVALLAYGAKRRGGWK